MQPPRPKVSRSPDVLTRKKGGSSRGGSERLPDRTGSGSEGLPDRVALPSRPGRPPTHAERLVQARVAVVHPTQASAPVELDDSDLSPKTWNHCFDQKEDLRLPSRNATFRIYAAGLTQETSLAMVFLHGGGHCALSWAMVAERLKAYCAVLAFDARAHGNSFSEDENDLSAQTQVYDAAALIKAFFEERSMPVPKLVVCGHSMGGAIAVRLAASNLLDNVIGLVVIDVVEGTAMSALPYMSSWLQGRPKSFSSVSKAVKYVTRAGHVRNPDSARISVPPQMKYDDRIKRWVWRTRLEESETYWKGWFQGLSSSFLSVKAAKMLVLANVDRLDKDLMIAQMQGKFQNILIPAAGHTVHEDQPDETARVLLEYLQRNLFIERLDDSAETSVFQQRRPIPPCC
ncbi:Protein phosphatase methylesterase 1 [Gracilariopsis chorda]|uniref:protein phosphatase methylesterase-1 n=1 Tax=Gracilariopsis chorda TaxID=448386 RepID=A0A2V3J114_9FLOR|nr:Protein phosphatase methylesterase 1 [Gracilariopsis chorda]|eukprot:PXF48096.1 Protein phosphatase methylesterase 1 [Gracilariopsis chorda]